MISVIYFNHSATQMCPIILNETKAIDKILIVNKYFCKYYQFSVSDLSISNLQVVQTGILF